MSRSRLWIAAILLATLAGAPGGAQTFPTPAYFRQLVFQPTLPAQLSGPEGLRDYVTEGKLRLTLADAIRLTLLNNTDVRINQQQVEQAKFGVLSAHQPFAPTLNSFFNSQRSSQPTTNQLQVGPTSTGPLSTLNQFGQSAYSQTFQTGTNFQTIFNGSKGDTNSSFFFFNPFLTSSLTLQLTQPLLRNRGLFPNRAPIVIARRNLEQSRQTFEAGVNNSMALAIGQYWNVVQGRENLKIARTSLDQAQASYEHDKRALELGALSPLDIYRSESQVAQRRVQVIQSEYLLRQTEDQFRQVVGADLDPYIRALDLDLVENPEPQGELFSMDAKTALEQALKRRPELQAFGQQLSNDDTSIRLAHNFLMPDVELSGFYTSTGLGGNQLNAAGKTPRVIPGGFGDALSQLFGFGFPTYGFTLALNLPIKSPAARAGLGRALVAKRTDLYGLRKQQQTVALDVLNAVHQLEEAKLSMAAARIARDLAQKNLEAEQRKHELGAETIFFVLEAQTELATAEVSLVQAEIGYQLAVAGVDRATGTLLERHHVQIEELSGGAPPAMP
jgi:outer membrane protein